MALDNQEIRRFAALGFILLVLVLAFLIIQPLFLSIITGLILAYACFPIYKLVFKLFREKTTSALAVCLIMVIILFIPAWFIIPLMLQQMFDIFSASQDLDVYGFIGNLLPSFSEQLQRDISTTIVSFIGTITSTTFNTLTSFIFELPTYLLYLAVVIFVFFFAIRDADKLKAYVEGLSPLRKDKEKLLARQFKEITSSIVFGYIVVGLIQGVATGLGLVVFGIPNSLLLTVFAVLFSVIPMVGPGLVWVPAGMYLLIQGNVTGGIGFLLYGALFVSTLDNFLRPYLVARRTNVPSVIVLIGMIGGLFVFGVLGLILGPLILAYVLILLDAYKSRTLAEMFNAE